MNLTRKLRNLIQNRDAVASRLAQRKAQSLAIERALALCDELEKTIPDKVTLIEAAPVDDVQGKFTEECFAGMGELMHQSRHAEAFLRLHADLPEIRKYWTKAQAELAD